MSTDAKMGDVVTPYIRTVLACIDAILIYTTFERD